MIVKFLTQALENVHRNFSDSSRQQFNGVVSSYSKKNSGMSPVRKIPTEANDKQRDDEDEVWPKDMNDGQDEVVKNKRLSNELKATALLDSKMGQSGVKMEGEEGVEEATVDSSQEFESQPKAEIKAGEVTTTEVEASTEEETTINMGREGRTKIQGKSHDSRTRYI